MRHTIALALLCLAPGCVDDADDALDETEQAVTGWQWYQRSTPYDATNPRTLDVACPRGTVPTHVGYHLDDGSVVLGDQAVSAEPVGGRWRLTATEFGGSPSWRLAGIIVCVTPPYGYEHVMFESPLDGADTQQLYMECPAGKVALGAGFSADDGSRIPVVARLTYSMPSFDGTSWLMNARAFGAGAWQIRGTLVCAEPWDLPGYHVVIDTGPPGTYPRTTHVADCPPGAYTLGGGWGVLDTGDAILEGIPVYDNLYPHGWGARARFDSVSGDPWQLQVAAICSY